MVRSLLFLCFLFAINSAMGQQRSWSGDFGGEKEVVAWNTIKPEKLDASNLRILPSNKLLRIDLKEDVGFTKIVIQDLNGNTILESAYDSGSDLDISTLKPGNYLIKVISANRVLQGKFGKRSL